MMRSLSLLLILIIIGCKCPKKAVEASGEAKDPGSLTKILSDNYGGAAEEELRILRSEGELQKFFAQINKTRKPGLAIPTVDFERDMVIVYSAGKTQSTQMPELEIKADKNNESLLLGIKGRSPQMTSTDTGAITMPFVLYTMAKSEKQVVLDQIDSPK